MIAHFKSKIKSLSEIEQLAQLWKDEGQQLVFTNGCFDILHYGHIHYLAEAKAEGDKLVIGLNSSASVSRLKGPHRPINDDKTRLFLLAALECVDAVVIFEEDTPLELIKLVLPDVLVKGGDWTVDQIVGSKEVIESGGEVKSLAFMEGYSTTNIEAKIKKG
ncbi:MAG: rfaE bifunctional protein nucleotidyltransferase chain/domain [Polaribacter sp.]|jgi:rfaE bifunctional protein nucleotidyltransferase chain/domain